MYINEKRRHCLRQTLAPFTRIRCYLKTKFFCCSLIWHVLFCFLRFGLSMTTVTENASYQNAFQSGDLNTFASRLRAVDGRKRRFSNTMKSYIIYHENYACSVRDVIVFPSFFKVLVWMGENFEYATCGSPAFTFLHFYFLPIIQIHEIVKLLKNLNK